MPPLLDIKYKTHPLRFKRAANYAQPRINPVGDECWDDCASTARAARRRRRFACWPRTRRGLPPMNAIG